MSAVWSSRFLEKIDKRMEVFNASIHFDYKLFQEDIKVSLAHIEQLSKLKIISVVEKEKIVQGLIKIKKKFLNNEIKFKTEDEDIHSFVENELKKIIGSLAGKLHTGRSRNDLVATDLRLYINYSVEEHKKLLKNLLITFYELAEKNQMVILPGFTHLQGAQPITFSFYLLAYFFMFLRDYERLVDNQKRIKLSPLGAGAFSGVNYAIDRKAIQKKLGFDEILFNAMDAIADRDYLLEFHSNLSIIMMHLSRISEDFIIFSNKQFDFIEIDERYSTGSSIMPNKKNADALELIRGKTGRVYGNLLALLTTLKALPLSYNKDLQEDKEGSFDSISTLNDVLTIFEKVLKTIIIKKEKMLLATEKGYLQATDVADYLVKKNIPFREAHQISGALVKYLEKNDKVYKDLTLKEYKEFSNLFENDIYSKLDLKKIIENKKSLGSTSFLEVKKQLKIAKKELSLLK